MTTRPTAEIIAIGTELLSGDTVDTNSSRVARVLRGTGVEILFISAVGDDEALIAEAVARGLERSHVVLTTGGLGPTVDDKTRVAVARATGRSLILRPDLLKQIASRFVCLGRPMSENNCGQAYTPDGALPIANPIGTAPCFILEHGRSRVICLPGVPSEMTYLLEREVVPYIRRLFPLAQVIKTRVLHTAGLGESVVDSKIGDLEALQNPTVGLAAHPGVVDIRITARAANEAEAHQLIARVEDAASQRLGKVIYGSDGDSLGHVVVDQLEDSGQTVSVIESGTRGQLAEKLALGDDGRGVFQAGVLRPKCPVTGELDAELRKMVSDCLDAQGTDLSVASMVVSSEEGIQVGVAVGRANPYTTVTKVSYYGGHVDSAGELGANLGLNLLRTWRS